MACSTKVYIEELVFVFDLNADAGDPEETSE